MEICGYRVIKRLSASEFSNVYLLENSIVAKISRDKDREFIERIYDEIRVLEDLQGLKGVVKLIGTCEWKGLPVILMEYIDGLNLYEYVKKRGPLKGYSKVLFAKRLLEILKGVHRKGYVIRDLKPNHVIFRNGRVDDIVLIDFGCSYRHGQTVIGLDRRISSPPYTHPHLERWGGAEPYYDLYSYAAVLLYAFTGKDPRFASPREAGFLEDLIRNCLDPEKSKELESPLNIDIPDKVIIEHENRSIEVGIGRVTIGRVGEYVYVVSNSEQIWLCKDRERYISRLSEGGHIVVDFIDMKLIRLSKVNKPAIYRNGRWIPIDRETHIKSGDKIALAYGERSGKAYLTIKIDIIK